MASVAYDPNCDTPIGLAIVEQHVSQRIAAGGRGSLGGAELENLQNDMSASPLLSAVLLRAVSNIFADSGY